MKWLQYPDGVTVPVKDQDAETHRKRIMKEREGVNIVVLDKLLAAAPMPEGDVAPDTTPAPEARKGKGK